MASITCRRGSEHKHSSLEESKICWGILRPAVPPPSTYTVPVEDAITRKQYDYIVDILKGDPAYARRLTKRQASQYITDLKSGKASQVTTPVEEPDAPEVHVKRTTKTQMIEALIDGVPTGYFAVRRQEGSRIYFVRVSKPTYGKYKGTLKVQSQHGPRLENRWVRWPSGKVSVYQWEFDIEDVLMLLLPDWKGAAKLYADEKKKCARCNTDLTVARSRFYRIGPECETHWTWWIEDREEEMGGPWETQPLEVQEKFYDTAGK